MEKEKTISKESIEKANKNLESFASRLQKKLVEKPFRAHDIVKRTNLSYEEVKELLESLDTYGFLNVVADEGGKYSFVVTTAGIKRKENLKKKMDFIEENIKDLQIKLEYLKLINSTIYGE